MSLNFKAATSLTKNLLRVQFLPLLIFWLIGTVITIAGEDTIHSLRPDEESTRWMIQGTMGLWEIFEGIAVFLVLSWGVAKVRDFKSPNFERMPFEKPYLGSFLAEYLRMIAQVLLYFLLLVIPAIIRYCRLIFVPYIALFSKQYRSDEIDAVELSLELTKKLFWVILAFFFASTGIQAAIEFLPNMIPELHTAPLRVLFSLFGFVISIWCYCFVFVLFERALEEKTWT
jgi:hypothetical protein